MTEATEIAAAPAALPLFYRSPRALEPARHAKAGLAERMDFGFARRTNAIALTATEFALAARCYPIVFSIAPPVVPFVVVGLREDENLFLESEGHWRDDAYVPAYVRRYPFIFSEVPDSTKLVLCVDEGAEHFERESRQPFFIDGKPGEAWQRVLRFSETFQTQYEDTRRFGQWLDENRMLEDRMARAELDDGQVLTLRGFRLIDPQKLRALEEAQVLELHRKGWLPLLHFHLQSLNNWAQLARLVRSRKQRPPGRDDRALQDFLTLAGGRGIGPRRGFPFR